MSVVKVLARIHRIIPPLTYHYTVLYVDGTSTVNGIIGNPGCGFKTSAPLAMRGCASFDALSIIASIFDKC